MFTYEVHRKYYTYALSIYYIIICEIMFLPFHFLIFQLQLTLTVLVSGTQRRDETFIDVTK